MNIAQKIGAAYRISNQLTPILLFLSLFTNFGMIVFLGQKPQVVASNVLVYDKNASGDLASPIRLECDSGSEGRRKIAIGLANDLMKILYEYEVGEKARYVAKYKNFFPFIKSGSSAEKIIRSSVERRSKELVTDSSTFQLDSQLTKAVAEGNIMYVAVTGTRTLHTPKGSISPQTIKLDLSFEIGADNAAFSVTDISESK